MMYKNEVKLFKAFWHKIEHYSFLLVWNYEIVQFHCLVPTKMNIHGKEALYLKNLVTSFPAHNGLPGLSDCTHLEN